MQEGRQRGQQKRRSGVGAGREGRKRRKWENLFFFFPISVAMLWVGSFEID